ncbi:MAG TPA: PLP-dependent aminotransferase family protein [Thermoanaerobaculia bacterium]|nr:PLP-dependent aminotransferase family protein [Thermoanaerobaculia bacterium]
MPKTTSAPILPLPPREPGEPAAHWLSSALRREILEGRLRPGARLPATRDLASQYGLSRGTIVSAFEALAAEGYVEGTTGSGTYVNRVLPDDLLEVGRPAGRAPKAQHLPRRRISAFGRQAREFSGLEARPARAFRTNVPALDLFPTTLWAQLTARCHRRASASLLRGCDPMGYPPLQEALAEYLATSRGVKCVKEQIAVVSGVQESIDLAARLFLDPGDRVCMEDPGYPGAALVFAALGAKISAVPLDEEGMTIPRPRQGDARLVYITPGHQFPTGIGMSLPRRLALLDWARTAGAAILEDDYDSEFRYSGRPVPALQGLDRHGSVLFTGSFSKVLFPSLRLGYLVVPHDLVDTVAAMRSISSRHAPLLEQAVLCDFITEGHFGRHLRRMREIYAERSTALVTAARDGLAGLLQLSDLEAGLQTAGWLERGIDGEAATLAAEKRGVEVTPLSRYTRGKVVREGLQLGFAAVDPKEIRRGVRELAVALEEVKR